LTTVFGSPATVSKTITVAARSLARRDAAGGAQLIARAAPG
jgi:hypothetical protein